MNSEEVLDLVRAIRKPIMYLGVLPVLVHLLKHKNFGIMLLLSILWIWVCDLSGYFLVVNGRWNVIIDFIFGPVAILFVFFSIGELIRVKFLYRITLWLSVIGLILIMSNGVFLHEISRTGIERSSVNYGISVPVMVATLLLFEVDQLIAMKEHKSPIGIRLISGGLLFYFSVGYVNWGMKAISLRLGSTVYRGYADAFFDALLTVAYIVLFTTHLVAAWQTNLSKEWYKMRR